MEGSGILIRVVQLYAWGLFLFSWAQLGWVDWKEQKIRNQYIVFWLKLVLLGYALILGQSLLGELGVIKVFILRDYYLALLGHAAFSLAAAYALWWLRIWPAGDVKLFVLLSLCYPMMRIPGSFRSGLLFLEVLINTFVPAAAFLFLTAGEYLWRTRFAHYKTHVTVRARSYCKDFRFPEFDFSRLRFKSFGSGLLPAGLASRESARAAVASLRGKSARAWVLVRAELTGWLKAYREHPRQFLIDALSWLSMMAVMSMISYYLNDVITSNVLKTLVCFALMFTWSRICQFIGTGWALAAVFGACGIILWRHPNVSLPALAVVFGHITIFSLCILLGVQLAFKIIAGKTGYVFLPFLMMLPGLIPWRFLIVTAWSGVGAVWFRLSALAHGINLPGLPRLPVVHLPQIGAFAAPAWIAAVDLSGLAVWAVMGLFFGLALVFVKIWDAESYQTVPIAHIARFMTLGPSLVARIEADPDFHDEHFSTLYADGLTGEQAAVLQEWCREEGLETVPLAPTISFANWIFLGYFLTRLLEGHVLRFLY
ncbi:MAG: hypothetical protein PHS14_07910 [Elusimicrobia bacterium]|nr:hypothetical protein [Elusimicrobiota bacterium]